MINSYSILIFDGECNLCNSWVKLVLRFDKKQRYKFCSLQSEQGRKLIGDQISLETLPQTVVLIENELEIVYTFNSCASSSSAISISCIHARCV